MDVPDRTRLEGCWDFDASPGERALSFQDRNGRGGGYHPLMSARGGKHAPWCSVMDDGGVDPTANEDPLAVAWGYCSDKVLPSPKTQPVNPKPYTLNPKPRTLNPKL